MEDSQTTSCFSVVDADVNDNVSVMSDDLISVSSNTKKIRAFIVTIFPPDNNKKWLLPETYFDTTILRNWCGQFERGGHTDKLHAHIWCEFHNTTFKYFGQLTKIFAKVVGTHPNIQTPKHRLSHKSRACSVNYVLKPDTRIAGDFVQFIWPHNKTKLSFDQALWDSKHEKPQKKEDVVETQRAHIESKPVWWSWDQILHESNESKALLCTCSWGKKYHEGRHAEVARRTIKHVIIMYGAGGTGKTTFAHSWDILDGEDKQERYYRRNPDDGHFWGGGKTAYKGQRVIHLEEFCGHEQLSRLKELCDIGKEGPPVNIKQGGTLLNHDTVIITSNHHPSTWYSKTWEADPKQFHPFWRRITQVWYFPSHRQDGELNIPDPLNPPFFIDQTDDWKAFNGDYTNAKDHAEVHWPPRQLSEFYDPDEPQPLKRRKLF